MNKQQQNYFTLNQPLPSDMEMEKKILGMIFNDNDILQDVRTIISYTDFYHDRHIKIFYAMCILQEKEAVIDAITVANVMGSDLQSVGVSYITDISISEPSSQGFEYVAGKIKELSSRRTSIQNLIKVANDMMNIDTDMNQNINKVSDVANTVLKTVNKGIHALDMEKLVEKTKTELIENLNNGGRLKGRQSGITDLDLALGGFENELIVVGARPLILAA